MKKIQKICTKTGFQIYPPPTTPPEPAPPDNIGTSMMRQYKGNLVSASQSSLDDITCKKFTFHSLSLTLSLSINFLLLFFSFQKKKNECEYKKL